jgi:hypothetical protein
VISRFTVTAFATDGNQWYMDGSPISGATGQTHDAKTTGDGNYHSVVTMNGCSSGESNHLDVVIVIGIGDNQNESAVKVYPNPTDGKFILEITSKNETTFTINVVNNMGVNMLSLDNFQVKGTVQRTMDFSSFSDGVYNLVLTNGKNSITKKIVLNK